MGIATMPKALSVGARRLAHIARTMAWQLRLLGAVEARRVNARSRTGRRAPP
jgi:hypothetical protein